jgi:hypothetical protein
MQRERRTREFNDQLQHTVQGMSIEERSSKKPKV